MRVAQRLSGDARVAALAGLLYAVDDAHVEAAGWIANRHATISVALALLALEAYHRWHSEGWRPGVWLSPGLLALSLLAGETAAPMVGIFLLLPLLREQRAPGGWPIPWSYLAVTGLWLVAYRVLDCGARGSGGYITPLEDPLYFALEAPRRALELVLQHFGPGLVALEVIPFGVALTLRTLAAAVLMPALALLLLRRLPPRGPIVFSLAAALLSFLPALSVEPHARLLTLAGGFLWVLAAQLLVSAWDQRATLGWHGRAAALSWVSLGATLHLVLAPVALWRGVGPQAMSAQALHSAHVLDGAAGSLQGAHLVVVNASNYLHAMSIGLEHSRRGAPLPASIWVLGTTTDTVHVTRRDDRSLLVATPHGYLDDLSNVWRGPRYPIRLGERIDVRGYSATVLQQTPDQRPLAVAFRFELPLDDPRLQFVYWTGEAYAPLRLPPSGRRQLPATRE
jgi:hypothetical protein